MSGFPHVSLTFFAIEFLHPSPLPKMTQDLKLSTNVLKIELDMSIQHLDSFITISQTFN